MAIIIRQIPASVIEVRLRKENQRKSRERFNTAQNAGFRVSIGDIAQAHR